MQYDRSAVLVYTPPVKSNGPNPELLKQHPIGSIFRCSDGSYWKIHEDPRGERYFHQIKNKELDDMLERTRKYR